MKYYFKLLIGLEAKNNNAGTQRKPIQERPCSRLVLLQGYPVLILLVRHHMTVIIIDYQTSTIYQSSTMPSPHLTVYPNFGLAPDRAELLRS